MAGRYRCRRNTTIPARVVPISDPCVPLSPAQLFPRDFPLEVEIGAGTGRFLISRAQSHPAVNYLAIERMIGRVRTLDRRASVANLDNIRVVCLEALYTMYYLLPRHSVRCVYIFCPDPWPKRRHHSHRLFSPFLRDALWYALESGGRLEVATDHSAYFQEICACMSADSRFLEIAPMKRTPDEQTDFELLFRGQGLSIGQCAFQALPTENEPPLAPMTLPLEMLPKKSEE
jgi:tRNA (guanine-N7-)-methyltransferase